MIVNLSRDKYRQFLLNPKESTIFFFAISKKAQYKGNTSIVLMTEAFPSKNSKYYLFNLPRRAVAFTVVFL